MKAWPIWIAALWWGSLTTIGFGVVPLLFVHLPSPALAGGMAARLFQVQTFVSALLGLALLIASRGRRSPGQASRLEGATGLVLAGMLLALLSEFAVAPRILARENLALWHGLGSAMYLLQWLCAGAVFRILVRPDPRDQA